MTVTSACGAAYAKELIEGLAEPDLNDDGRLQSMFVLGNQSSPELAFAHLKLCCPELHYYRGGWFLAASFDRNSVDVWLDRESANIGEVEALFNHLHIQQDIFGGFNDEVADMTGEDAVIYGNILGCQWKIWARDAYNLDIDVSLYRADEGYEDVQIWFTSNGPYRLSSETDT